jgi:hypothetical protein
MQALDSSQYGESPRILQAHKFHSSLDESRGRKLSWRNTGRQPSRLKIRVSDHSRSLTESWPCKPRQQARVFGFKKC